MPIMDGVETIKVVRADENLKQLPIIMLTTDETRKTETLEHGANGFLMKPIKREKLFEKIHSLYI
jgi:putative two-component system response regulator